MFDLLAFFGVAFERPIMLFALHKTHRKHMNFNARWTPTCILCQLFYVFAFDLKCSYSTWACRRIDANLGLALL